MSGTTFQELFAKAEQDPRFWKETALIAEAELAALRHRNEKLEKVAEAAKARIAVWTRETYIALHDALAALEADDE